MAIMSDPQFGYCESDACKNGPAGSARANLWHASSVARLAKNTSSFAGGIVNGDLTNTADGDQIGYFETFHENMRLNIYAGLGNHDYDNYYDKWCAGDGNAVAKYYCTRRMLNWFEEHVNSIPDVNFDLKKGKWGRDGSYAYLWEIGDYHFVELNNYPSYSVEFRAYISSRVGHENFDIQNSLGWLLKDLERTSSRKKVVLNVHAFDSDLFDEDSAVFPLFQKVLDAHPSIVALFCGHWHSRVGQYGTVASESGTEIPVFFSGSAEYNHYLKVTFRGDGMTVQPIDSTEGEIRNHGSAVSISY